MTKVYFWNAKANFGDQLSPILLEHFCGIEPVWASPAEAELVGCGSVLDVLPRGWSGVIAGAGRLHDRPALLGVPLTLGVRGPLTLKSLGLKDSGIVLGDPGLLASEMVNPEPRKYKLSLLPHWTDTQLYPRELERARRGRYAEPHFIHPADDPLNVVAEIGSSAKLITSSLHGAIVADAWGVPRRVEPFPNLGSRSEGGRFKFDDHGASIGQKIEFGTLQTPSREKIEAIQHDLFEMLAKVPNALL